MVPCIEPTARARFCAGGPIERSVTYVMLSVVGGSALVRRRWQFVGRPLNSNLARGNENRHV